MSVIGKESLAAAWDSRFASLRQLREGWNGYSASPPSEEALVAARSFVDTLLRANYEPSRVAPSVVGGVGVTRRQGSKNVYVEFYNDGKVLALFSDDDSEPVINAIEPNAKSFEELVKEMRDYLDG